LFASQGILAALYSREKTGLGRRIEISLLESLLAAMINLTSTALIAGREPAPSGTRQANIVPYQLFSTANEPMVIGVPNDRIWKRFCQALGREDWAADPRFANNAGRNQHREELVPQIEAVLRTRPALEWRKLFEEWDVPCAPVAGVSDALAMEQLQARGFVIPVEHPALGLLRLAGNPIRMDGVEDPRTHPPMLGEHTQAVLDEFSGG
jgi:formyl-CoA transferase/CoA:oxalate CoA-transferase